MSTPKDKQDRQLAIAALGRCAELMPEQRLCQIIVNATGHDDPFYVTDDSLAVALADYGAHIEWQKSKLSR